MECAQFMFQLAIVYALTLGSGPAGLNLVAILPPMTLEQCERIAERARRYETNTISAICI